MYSKTNEHLGRVEGQEGFLTNSLLTPPDIPIYDPQGEYASTVREGYTRPNAIAIGKLDKNILERQKLNGNIYLDVNPIKALTWHTELGYDIGFTNTENWQPTYDFGSAVKREKNQISWQAMNNMYWQLKNYITYNGSIGKHSFTAMVGQEAWESSYKSQRIGSENLPSNVVLNPALGDKQTYQIADGLGSSAMASFFTRETYNYDDRYLATYTYRYDGSSNFGPNNRWAGFHSVAASWRFSNEAFFESVKSILSNGKLRLGWGQTGNSSIGGGLWGANLVMFPTDLGPGYKQSQIANPYVKWETQEQWNIGLDLGFLNDRINLSIDAYDKTAKDMLMELQLPTYFGSRGNGNSALTAPMGNYGTINNKGLEIALSTHNLTGQFRWDTDFSISFNKNKLVALTGTDASGIEGYGQWSDIISLSKIGGPLYEFYGYIADGVYTNKAEIEEHLWGEIPEKGYDRYSTVFVGDIKYRDLNGDGKINTDDRTSIGSPLPTFTYGFNNTFNYKNFDLTVFIQGSYGNKLFNALGRDLTSMGYWSNQLTKAMDYASLVAINDTKTYPIVDANGRNINNWFEDIDNVTLSNPNTKMSRAGQGLPYNNQRISTQYIEDGSYLRVKNIAFGYTLPKNLLRKYKIENIRLYANIQNLCTWTKYSGYDPEVGVNPQDANGRTFGFDQGRYPAPRVISFGANLSF
jgi:TonB-linked SusC/RagA family outer membrane protein